MIVPERMVQIILPKDTSYVTEFARRGNVYKMDMWVRKDAVVAKPGSGMSTDFTRQGR